MSNRPKPDKHNVFTIFPIVEALRKHPYYRSCNPRYIRQVAEQIARNRAIRQYNKSLDEELNDLNK